MNEQQIRKIIRDEINKQSYQTGKPNISPHTHDGVNSSRINQSDIIPGVKFNGTIDMTQNGGIYTIPVTGNPTQVSFIGGALDTTDTPALHAMVVGNAQFGTGYQFQPLTSNSVALNNIKLPIIQGSGAFVYTNRNGGSGATAILRNSEGHIVYASDASNNIYATATITSFNNSNIYISVVLAPNWIISGLWTVM